MSLPTTAPAAQAAARTLGVPRVGRHRHVEPLDQRLHRRDHPVELLLLAHRRTRAGLDAADVEDVGPLRHQGLRPPKGEIEGERGTLVVERVRRPVEDPHHQAAAGEVVAAGAETQSGVADRHGRAGYLRGKRPEPRCWGRRRESPACTLDRSAFRSSAGPSPSGAALLAIRVVMGPMLAYHGLKKLDGVGAVRRHGRPVRLPVPRAHGPGHDRHRTGRAASASLSAC